MVGLAMGLIFFFCRRLRLASHSNFANNQPAESKMIFKSYHQPDPHPYPPFPYQAHFKPVPTNELNDRLHPTIPSNDTSLLLGKGI
jgi:hypothetical protein